MGSSAGSTDIQIRGKAQSPKPEASLELQEHRIRSNGVRLLRWKPAERIHHLEPIHHLLLASPKIGLDHQLHGRRTPSKTACFESGSLTRSS